MYVLNLKLNTNYNQNKYLSKIFYFKFQIKNKLVNYCNHKLESLFKDTRYKELIKEYVKFISMKFGSDNYMKQKPHCLRCDSSQLGMCIKEVVKMNKILLVIDMQNGFMNKNTEVVYKKIVNYLWGGVVEYNKVVFTEYINNKNSPAYKIGYNKMFCGNEIELYSELREWCVCHRELYRIFTKDTYSCWYSKDRNGILFTEWLKENGITDIDICGVESNCCVLASAFDLFDNGYKINIMLDKCANMNGKRMSELMIKELFG